MGDPATHQIASLIVPEVTDKNAVRDRTNSFTAAINEESLLPAFITNAPIFPPKRNVLTPPNWVGCGFSAHNRNETTTDYLSAQEKKPIGFKYPIVRQLEYYWQKQKTPTFRWGSFVILIPYLVARIASRPSCKISLRRASFESIATNACLCSAALPIAER